MTAPTQTPADPSEPIPMERETVPSERDAKRFLELLDRSALPNARLARSLAAYQAATLGHPERPFEWT